MNTKTYGADISHHQGETDIAAFSKELGFLVIRASYGVGFADRQFSRNRDLSRDAGIPIGFYHYAYPTYNEPEAEADWFLSVIGEIREGEFMALDFEEAYPDSVGWSLRFLERIREKKSYLPLIYMNQNAVTSHDWSPVSSRGYGLWIARYGANTGKEPKVDISTGPWPFAAMWQYTSKGTVAGRSPIDLDVFYGDRDQLLKYGWHPQANPQETVYEIPVTYVPTPVPESAPVQDIVPETVPEPQELPTKQEPVKLKIKNPFIGGTHEAVLHFVYGGLRYTGASFVYYFIVRFHVISINWTTPEAIVAVGLIDRLAKSVYVKLTTGPEDDVK